MKTVTKQDVQKMEAKKVELVAIHDGAFEAVWAKLTESEVVSMRGGDSSFFHDRVNAVKLRVDGLIAVLSAGIESAQHILNIQAALDIVNPPEEVRVVDFDWLKDVEISEPFKIRAPFMSKDQNFQEESTAYWFDVNGEEFGVVESGPQDPIVVDCDSCPVNLNDHRSVHLQGLLELVTDDLRNA